MNQVPVQSRIRFAHIIQIIVRLSKNQLTLPNAHLCSNSFTCAKCKREVKMLFVQQSGLKESTAVKVVANAYNLTARIPILNELVQQNA